MGFNASTLLAWSAIWTVAFAYCPDVRGENVYRAPLDVNRHPRFFSYLSPGNAECFHDALRGLIAQPSKETVRDLVVYERVMDWKGDQPHFSTRQVCIKNLSLWGECTPNTTWFQKTGTEKLPEHEAALKEYFGILKSLRGFTDERIDMFGKIEKKIPVYRQRLTRVYDRETGELVGLSRSVNGNYSPKTSLRNHIGDEDVYFKHLPDGRHLLPVEHSILMRGEHTTLIDELRANPGGIPDGASIDEIGRYYKNATHPDGDISRLYWELETGSGSRDAHFYFLENVGISTHSESQGGWLVMHTDRKGALKFPRIYGAKIREAIFPQIDPLTRKPKVRLNRQNAVLETDPLDAEYILLVDTSTFNRYARRNFLRYLKANHPDLYQQARLYLKRARAVEIRRSYLTSRLQYFRPSDPLYMDHAGMYNHLLQQVELSDFLAIEKEIHPP